MASSASSGLSSYASNSLSDREPTPEHPPITAYNTLAPQWWDERGWAFAVWLEDDASLTDGEESLQFLVDGELEANSDDAWSWDGVESSDEKEESEEDTSSDEYPPTKRFRAGSEDDNDDEDEDEEAPTGFLSSSSEDDAG